MRFWQTLLHTVVILSLLHGMALAEGPPLVQATGRIVIDLSVEGTAISPADLQALVPFSKGSRFRPELVREGIVNFYRTGLYDQVEVLLKELPGGVAVKYSVIAKKWLEQVQFKGNLYLDDRELVSKVDLRSQDELTDDKLRKNVERLRQYYDYRGFTRSEISYEIEPGTDNRTRVIFRIREGKRAIISDVRLRGDAGISRSKLLSIISSMPGHRLDGEDLDSDLDRVRDHIREGMYLTPDISYKVEPAEDFPDSVRLIFNVVRGPYFRLQVRMSDDSDLTKVLKKMRAVFLKSQTPEKAKLSIRRDILNQYLEAGYPFATLDLEDRMEDTGARAISLIVDKGLPARMSEVRVEGVQSLSGEKVDSVLDLAPGEPFVKSRMERGIENLQQEYRRAGFLSVEISREPLNFIPRDGYQEVSIHLSVKEGPRNIVRNVRIQGSPLPAERTGDLLAVRSGDPYFPEAVAAGRDELLQGLGSRGYLYASVTVEEPVTNPDDSVDLEITVNSGPLVRLGTVIITGNEAVDPRIIRVALDLKRGEVLTREKILKAQERIYDLKVMNSVDVQLADAEEPAGNKDLIVRVRERAKYVIGLRFGFGSEDKLRGEASVTNRNMMGMARSLSLTGKASDIEQSTTLLYSHPWFQSLPLDMTLSLSDLVEKRESYSRDSLSASVDFVRALSERTETRFGYFFEGLRLFDVSQDAQLSPDDEGKTDVAALEAEILHDARDDFLDPWSGVLGDLILEYASQGLGSETEYIKSQVAVHRYLTLVDSVVLAGLLRMGRVTAYGKSEEVIISKRFFLGGQNSVRGYQLDSLGPRDSSGAPVGGNYMVNANLEVRYPLYKTLRGVVFVDSGSVWLENAADPVDERFQLRAAAGAGVRWTSPIGPLSLDYGYKLNPATEEEDRSRIHLSIGHAF